VTVKGSDGAVLAKLPFGPLDGTVRSEQTVHYDIPADAHRDMLRVEPVVDATGGFHRAYVNLPAIPVVTDGVLGDPLHYNVPLHRLHASPVELAVNGTVAGATVSEASPVMLSVKATGALEGVSYMKDGAVINEPTPNTAAHPVLDNWMPDPTFPRPPKADYYGALAQFADGTIAYATGTWLDDNRDRVWVSYDFRQQDRWAARKLDATKIRDISGHALHGTLMQAWAGHGSLPHWVPVGYMHDALSFDGVSSEVDLGILVFPVGPLTVELMVKPDSVGRDQILLSQGGSVAALQLNADGTVSLSRTNDARLTDTAKGTTRLAAGKWTAIVATYDMRTLKLYINGRLDAQVASNGVKSTEGARIGGPFWGATDSKQMYAGQVARFRVLTGAATPAQIARDSATLDKVYNTALVAWAAQKGTDTH
jgi:hypothetical protein